MSGSGAWNQNMGNQSYTTSAEHLPSSFTPINPSGAFLQCVNPMRTVRRSIDSDSWYNNADDPLDDMGAVVMPSSKSKNKRNESIVLAAFQAGLEESHSEGPARKKQKSATQQRSKSAKAPSRLSSFVLEDVGTHATSSNHQHVVLDTPPVPLDSKTKPKPKFRAKSKPTSKTTAPTPKEKNHPPFKAPTITKPLPVEKTNSIPSPVYSPPTSNHPTLTTTENAVKYNSQPVSLSQTTMSKLRSFLYIRPNQQVTSPSTIPIGAAKPVLESQPTQPTQLEIHHPSSEYGSYSTHGSAIIEDSGGNAQDSLLNDSHLISPSTVPYAWQSSDEILLDESWNNQNHDSQVFDGLESYSRHGQLSPIEENGNIDPPLSMQAPSTYVTVDTVLLTEPTIRGNPRQDMSPQTNSDYEDPTSSEATAFKKLLENVDVVSDEGIVLSELPKISDHDVDVLNEEEEHSLLPDDANYEEFANGTAREESARNGILLPPFTQNTFIRAEERHPEFHMQLSEVSDDEAMLLDDPVSSRVDVFNDSSEPQVIVSDNPLPSEVDKIDDNLHYGFENEIMVGGEKIPSRRHGFDDNLDDEAILFEEPVRPALNKFGNNLATKVVLDEKIRPGDELNNFLHGEAMVSDDPIPFAVDDFGDGLDGETMPDQWIRSEIDEFDDGLDDLDLLEILSTNPLLVAQAGFKSSFDDIHPPVGQNPPAFTKLRPTTAANMTPRRGKSSLVCPQILDFDLDDEFPIDESDEEEMLKLPLLMADPLGLPLSSMHRHSNGQHSGPSEVYDSTPQLSPHKSFSEIANQAHSPHKATYIHSESSPIPSSGPRSDVLGEGEEWAHRSTDQFQIIDLQDTQPLGDFDEMVLSEDEQLTAHPKRRSNLPLTVRDNPSTNASASSWKVHPDYKPLQSFARPDFPTTVRDRCPVIGLSGQTFLRTCFKIGEMFKEGKRCSSFGQDAIIELFARVTFSSREVGTTKQYFVFADLWRDNPPFPEGILMNYKTTGLADTESKAFVDLGEAKMVRCLGRLKRDVKNATGWLLNVITIRETNWEEIRYTKKVACASGIKSEPV